MIILFAAKESGCLPSQQIDSDGSGKQTGPDDWFRKTTLRFTTSSGHYLYTMPQRVFQFGSLPGQYRWNIDDLCTQAKRAEELGIPAIALFPSTPIDRKTPDGEEAYNPDNLVCRSIRAIRSCTTNLGIIADVAFGSIYHSWPRWIAQKWCGC